MMALNVFVLVAALLMPGTQQPPAAMRADVDRFVRAAEQLTGVWPTQPPPAIPEVALVARHGKSVVPLLTALLSDDPNAERDQLRWKVQQQAALALCRIYSESTTYCELVPIDGDLPERNGNARKAWLAKISREAEMQAMSADQLLERFKQAKAFWQQFEYGEALAATGDRGAIGELQSWLTLDDRHARGNAAFVLARLGDLRGFNTIAKIFSDRSPRIVHREMMGSTGHGPGVPEQISCDRDYAGYLLAHLKDPRAVPLLIPLLTDRDVNSRVAWSLGQIGDPRAVSALMRVLDQDDPSMRVVAIRALEELRAEAALPKLRELLKDDRKSNSGLGTTVAESARHAIAAISQPQ
jgi:HEAT repeat protein